jgi:hypothetical protein
MATWPTIGDARDYIGEVLDEQMPVLEQVFNSALEKVEYHVDSDLILTDDDYVDIVPETIRLAVFMQTSRWFRRRLSPEGVAGFNDFGAVRVSTLDPDIMDAITSSGARSWGFA